MWNNTEIMEFKATFLNHLTVYISMWPTLLCNVWNCWQGDISIVQQYKCGTNYLFYSEMPGLSLVKNYFFTLKSTLQALPTDPPKLRPESVLRPVRFGIFYILNINWSTKFSLSLSLTHTHTRTFSLSPFLSLSLSLSLKLFLTLFSCSTYQPTYLPTDLFTYLSIYLHAYLNTYIPTLQPIFVSVPG